MKGRLDPRLVLLLAALVVAVVLRYTVFSPSSAPTVVAAMDSIPLAERRLERIREQAASVPARQKLFDQAKAELTTRERGIIQADTASQAQAHLLDTIHRIAAQNGFDARGADQFTQAQPLGDAYGVVAVTESFTCQIDQLVNFLAALDNQPEIIATNDIHIDGGNEKNKSIRVRVSLSGVVSRKLVPAKKGSSL